MTYDIEGALRHALRVRVDGDELMGETARLADLIADGFRRDFGESMDMEDVGKALVVTSASLVPLIDPKIPSAVIANMIGLAGENLVRTARARAAEMVTVGETGPVWMEHVLTWHPVDGSEPTEIPFHTHVACPEQVGEFRLSTREVPPPADDELANPAANLVVDFLSLVDVSVTAEQAAGWTRAQRKQAVQWAAATHLSASDNDDVEVPPRPAFLDEVSGA